MSKRRQLAAILFTDMVGYTALMSRDESLANRLRHRHGQVLRKYHNVYNGEIIQYFGDGTLSIFSSSLKALQCAIDIQRDLQLEPKVPLRIGLHSGEVMFDEEGLYGSAVNIASRLESFAIKGAILTSARVRNEVINQSDLYFKSMGLFQLKNVPQPMEIYAVANESIAVPTPEELEGKGKRIEVVESKKLVEKSPHVHAPSVSPDGIAVNDLLIEVICETVALHSKGLDHELNKIELDIPSIKREIIDAFPTPIGEQLRILFTRSNIRGRPDEVELFTTARLKQLVITHRTLMRFISFILLSQLWDEKRDRTNLQLEPQLLDPVQGFLATDQAVIKSYDFAKLITGLQDFFQHHNIMLFIDELKQWQVRPDRDAELYEAHQYMVRLNEELLSNKIDEKDTIQLCLRAEENLGILLDRTAFLVKYKLVTIKNIEIVKSRHEIARFRHKQITLNKALTVASTGVAEVDIDFDNYADNKSVLFLKVDEGQIIDYLNLTPFIIDENALTNDLSSKIFLFSHRVNQAYFYQFLNNPMDQPLAITQRHYNKIKNQFDRFCVDILNEKIQLT